MENCTPQNTIGFSNVQEHYGNADEFISYDFRDYTQKSGIGDIIAMNKAIATRRSYYCQYWFDLGRI